MDELEAIEAELKECLQELEGDSGDLSVSGDNQPTSDLNETVNEMKTDSKGNENTIMRENRNKLQGQDEAPGQGSEKVLQWKAAFQKRVEEKDGQEEKAKTFWLETAKRDLEEFYKRHENSMRTTSAKLKEEAEHVESSCGDGGALGDCSSGCDKAGMWKRVADLCDFSSKTRSAKDVSRMRSVIVALSQAQPSDEQAK